MICTKCGKFGEAGAFSTFRNPKGEVRRRGCCKVCRGLRALENFENLQKWRKNYNAENADARHKRNAEKRQQAKDAVDAIKSVTPCADCGVVFHPVCMDFDHANGGKTKAVSRLVSGAYKMHLILEEIAKCELVCANCHRMRTHSRGENRSPRG